MRSGGKGLIGWNVVVVMDASAAAAAAAVGEARDEEPVLE